MRSSHINISRICLIVLTILAVFYTLRLASEFILPVVLAIVTNMVLLTPMRFLHRRTHLPKPLVALLLILLMFTVMGMIVAAISVPATGWSARAPEGLAAAQKKLSFLRQPISFLEEAGGRMQALMNATGGAAAPVKPPPGGPVSVGLGSFGSSVLMGTRDFMGQLFTYFIMLFFLLAEGDSLLRRFVEIMPSFSDKRRAVQIASQVERNISRYLATITMMNLLVGAANMLQCWLVGMPNPLLWGVMAFMLNYIPIIGPLTGVVIFFFVGLFAFAHPLHALVAPTIYLCIHLLEGETITPMLLARRFTLNPVLVMTSLIFWDWMWGITGAFLSVPLLAVFKIVCDHIDSLTPIGHLVGGGGTLRLARRHRGNNGETET
ncbi:AI-2E family transporter [Acetobacter sp. AN02]|uniref:AI-2E family transporter n=1 Tax=Acetobacter sp. AN02 TaxID=2894186 RepID=UPI0038D1F24C